MSAAADIPAESKAPAAPRNERTRRLLEQPILPTLLRLAWPNMLIMLAQASSGLIETWWVGHLGTEALAGMALVFPGVMLMQMLSGGSIGGGISSAVARALGRGEPQGKPTASRCMRSSSTSSSVRSPPPPCCFSGRRSIGCLAARVER